MIQAPVTPNNSTQSTSQASSSNNTQQALFTQGYVDWSSLPDDVGHALFTSELPLNLALMAIDSSDDSIPVTQADPSLSASSESLAAADQVTPQILEKLCSDSCIEAFVNIKKANVLLSE